MCKKDATTLQEKTHKYLNDNANIITNQLFMDKPFVKKEMIF